MQNTVNTTILVHTVHRPFAFRRLAGSIALFAPKPKFLAYDDSGNDIGVSAGRNWLVKQADTKYVFTCDDDCVFLPGTNLETLEKFIEENDYDIVGIPVFERGVELNYTGRFEIDGSRVHYVHGEPLEFIPNIFIAKREALLRCPWDERLKIGEHFAYFHKYRGQLKIGFCPTVAIEHQHCGTPKYDVLRARALDFVKMYMRENGITERIDFNGEHLMAK